jgi:nicotinamide-nucleotide amidase
MNILDVNEETLERHGAVSREAALEMLQGLKKIMDSDIYISITGIAGPDGGTVEKPVGTVYVGFLFGEDKPRVKEYHFSGLNRMEFKRMVAKEIFRSLDVHVCTDTSEMD